MRSGLKAIGTEMKINSARRREEERGETRNKEERQRNNRKGHGSSLYVEMDLK